MMLTYFLNHRPATKTSLRDGRKQGRYQELTPYGKVTVEGRYLSGHKWGAWREWTARRVPTLEQHWRRDQLDGRVRKYADGKVVVEATYKRGKAEGPYVEYRNGKPALTGQFAGDLRTGTWTSFDADGGVAWTATYKAGILDGPWRQLIDGVAVEGTMQAGRRTGTWTRTDKAGAVTKISYPASP